VDEVYVKVVKAAWRVALAGGVVYAPDWYDMLKVLGGSGAVA
jgi:hypothetical protein